MAVANRKGNRIKFGPVGETNGLMGDVELYASDRPL